jgi:hypothetical protein
VSAHWFTLTTEKNAVSMMKTKHRDSYLVSSIIIQLVYWHFPERVFSLSLSHSHSHSQFCIVILHSSRKKVVL